MYGNDKQRMIKFKPRIKLNHNISKWVQFIVLFQQQLNCDSFKQSAVSKDEFMSLLQITQEVIIEISLIIKRYFPRQRVIKYYTLTFVSSTI